MLTRMRQLHSRQELQDKMQQRERDEAERLKDEFHSESRRLRDDALRLSRTIREKEIALEESTMVRGPLVLRSIVAAC
jgi:hypothetical protein